MGSPSWIIEKKFVEGQKGDDITPFDGRDLKLVQDVEQKALRLNMGVFWHLYVSQGKIPVDSSFVVAHLPDGRSFIVMMFITYCDDVFNLRWTNFPLCSGLTDSFALQWQKSRSLSRDPVNLAS
jgi:hypothetical protein